MRNGLMFAAILFNTIAAYGAYRLDLRAFTIIPEDDARAMWLLICIVGWVFVNLLTVSAFTGRTIMQILTWADEGVEEYDTVKIKRGKPLSVFAAEQAERGYDSSYEVIAEGIKQRAISARHQGQSFMHITSDEQRVIETLDAYIVFTREAGYGTIGSLYGVEVRVLSKGRPMPSRPQHTHGGLMRLLTEDAQRSQPPPPLQNSSQTTNRRELIPDPPPRSSDTM